MNPIKMSDMRTLMVMLAVLMVSGPLSAQGVEELPPLMADQADEPVDDPVKVNASTVIPVPGPVMPHRDRILRKVDPDGGGGSSDLSQTDGRDGRGGRRNMARLPVSGQVGDTVLIHASFGLRGVPALVYAEELSLSGDQRVLLPIPQGVSLERLVFHVTVVHGDGSVTTGLPTKVVNPRLKRALPRGVGVAR